MASPLDDVVDYEPEDPATEERNRPAASAYPGVAVAAAVPALLPLPVLSLPILPFLVMMLLLWLPLLLHLLLPTLPLLQILPLLLPLPILPFQHRPPPTCSVFRSNNSSASVRKLQLWMTKNGLLPSPPKKNELPPPPWHKRD